MSMSLGLASWRLTFQLSPIFLTGGVAQNIIGGVLPLIALTEALNLADGLLSGATNIGLDDFFANWEPGPGAEFISNQVATYPFANQSVAANALIAQPLRFSMMMKCPVRDEGGYWFKTATMIALQQTLEMHNSVGGTYTVIMPTIFDTNCIMVGMRELTGGGDGHQPQALFQFDFELPLLTLQEARQSQNSLMAKLTNQTQVNGQPSWTGTGNVGQTNTTSSLLIPTGSGTYGGAVSAPPYTQTPVQQVPLQ